MLTHHDDWWWWWQQCKALLTNKTTGCLPYKESWPYRFDRTFYISSTSLTHNSQRQDYKICSMNDFPTWSSSGSYSVHSHLHSSVWRKENKEIWNKSTDRSICRLMVNVLATPWSYRWKWLFLKSISMVQKKDKLAHWLNIWYRQDSRACN